METELLIAAVDLYETNFTTALVYKINKEYIDDKVFKQVVKTRIKNDGSTPPQWFLQGYNYMKNDYSKDPSFKQEYQLILIHALYEIWKKKTGKHFTFDGMVTNTHMEVLSSFFIQRNIKGMDYHLVHLNTIIPEVV